MPDDQQQALFARIKTSLANFMKEPVLEGTTSTVYGDNKTTPPDDIRKHMDIKAKDELKWYALPGGLALVRKSAAIVILALLASSFAAAPALYAQEESAGDEEPTQEPESEVPVEEDPTTHEPVEEEEPVQTESDEVTEGSNGPTIDGLPLYPIKQLGEEMSRVPIRIQVIYKSGEAIVPEIESVDPASRAKIEIDKATPEEDRTTFTFSTEALDTWRVLIGQNYSSPVTQVVTVIMWGNTTEGRGEVLRETYPFINQTQFKLELRFTTSILPHIPTPRENMQEVLTPLRDVRGEIAELTESVDYISGGIISSAGLFQSLIVVLIFSNAVTFVQNIQQRRFINELLNLRESAGLELDPNYKPQAKKKRSLFGRED